VHVPERDLIEVSAGIASQLFHLPEHPGWWFPEKVHD